MEKTASFPRRAVCSLGITVILIALALPATAKSGPTTSPPATATNAEQPLAATKRATDNERPSTGTPEGFDFQAPGSRAQARLPGEPVRPPREPRRGSIIARQESSKPSLIWDDSSTKAAPPQSLPEAAKELTRHAARFPERAKGEAPKLEIVDGEIFRQTLDRIASLARECERRIAADKTDKNSDARPSHRKDLREITNEVFNLRMNSTKVWLPASRGCCSYLVDTRALHSLCTRTIRLSQAVCSEWPESGSPSGDSTPKPASIEKEHVNTSLIW